MKLVLYWAGKERLFDLPPNKGFEEALKLLSLLQEKGISVEIINTNKLPKEKLQITYEKACKVAIWKHIGIRRVFGTKRRGGGLFFGKEVPALLVYEGEGEYPSDVYPHREPGKGPLITIRDFLKKKLLRESELATGIEIKEE